MHQLGVREQLAVCPLSASYDFIFLVSAVPVLLSARTLSSVWAPAGRCSAVTEAGHPGPFRAGPGALGLAWGVAAAALCTECVLVIRGAPPLSDSATGCRSPALFP